MIHAHSRTVSMTNSLIGPIPGTPGPSFGRRLEGWSIRSVSAGSEKVPVRVVYAGLISGGSWPSKDILVVRSSARH